MVHRAPPFGSFPPKSGLVLALAIGSAFFGYYYGYEHNRWNHSIWKSFEKRLIKEERVKRRMAIEKVDSLEKEVERLQTELDYSTGKKQRPAPVASKAKKEPVDFIDAWVNIDMSNDEESQH
eukprot:TRINITY_DN3885_c0_g1_i1.p1 TRINITY_DN3885_c0_g1~~TRINITY_DN3885_c0_g1_i1.p1  ORF type:complete len:122 (-),score=16.05 TRINITY_DN3885_c0_g1_i1:100-465(-)